MQFFTKITPSVLGFDKVIDMESLALEDPNLYGQIVGSLMRVMTGNRPNLCRIVTKLSQHMSIPTVVALSAAKHVGRYLKGMSVLSSKFRKMEHPLKLIVVLF